MAAATLSPYINDAFLNFGDDPFNLPILPGEDNFSPGIIEDIMAQQDPGDVEQIMSGAMYQARVEYAAKRLAAVPKTFAEQAQTMFIHRQLFQEKSLPALQDALSACALYCLKSPENQGLVFANLQHKAQQLIASTDPLMASKAELLAALQALVLYQTIRYFDGDIRLRAQAEADEPVLAAWTNQLRARMHQLVPSLPASAGALLPTQTRAQDWQRWLVEESTRRTVLSSAILQGVYEFLKFGWDKASDHRLSFTAQRALWEAQSEYGWRTACSERERLEVRLAHWNDDVLKAAPSDLDELGVLIMATFWGMEPTGEWLGKGHLARFGLE
ncbi:transcription factor cys6 protein [Diplodia corticola]|uniref:Transcription factor cys6 protein n=1 Tax=Diplodia corticola TaxID=236234 RepID=A0A1J9R377_9PEZI|nr:transcription factor cys6 protein [Diplodia corticola]OJD35878.1 transcription factor cys6 protein [Diplodia corticola]